MEGIGRRAKQKSSVAALCVSALHCCCEQLRLKV